MSYMFQEQINSDEREKNGNTYRTSYILHFETLLNHKKK